MSELDVEISAGPVRPVSIPATTVDVPVLGGDGMLFGWSLRESTGAAVATAEIQIGGNPVAEIGLAAGGVSNAWFGPLGIDMPGNITLHMIAGSVTGAVYAVFHRSGGLAY